MSFKFTFREITSEDTEILRMLKLRNTRPEDHICCEILRGDGITMKTWYSKADIALLGEDYMSRVTWFTLCASTWFTCYQ